MTFKQCSIRGQFYGEIEAIKANDNDEYHEHFFSLLALCHTVVSEEKDGKITYQAQSPDENALVIAARTLGFEFLVSFAACRDHCHRKTIQSRTQNSVAVRFRDQVETYDLLNILEFNNYRKRMSVSVIDFYESIFDAFV
jgi:magnesium-transporting ATPase (P-type)